MDIVEIKEVPGLFYIKNAISTTSSGELIQKLDSCKWQPITPGNLNSRLVQHYGYKYDYKKSKINVPTEPFPDYLEELSEQALDICRSMNILPMKDYTFNQCIVNNYLPGQGISKHIDVCSYGEIICCYTVGGGAKMLFRNDEKCHDIYVEPGSLYIMSKEARYKWTHEMSSKKTDTIDGKRVARQRRISITFRNMPLKQ